MTTKTELESALKDAMRANDDLHKRTLRMALAAIRLAEIEKGGALDEPAVLAILQKEVKSRQEAIVEAQRANRPEMEAANKAEIAVLEVFMPEPLSEDELKAMAQEAAAEVGASTQADMGKVMRVLMPRLQGRATGDQASRIVRELLQQGPKG
jgi:uncharacterized protein YqeY